jgi:hypothetical protein
MPDRVLGAADPAGGLDAAALAGGPVPVADGLQQHLHDGRVAAGEVLPVDVFTTSAPASSASQAGAADVVVAGQLAGLEDDLEVRAGRRRARGTATISSCTCP